jgi:hypothetical protein
MRVAAEGQEIDRCARLPGVSDDRGKKKPTGVIGFC